MKIPKELTPLAYELSKKVFEGKLTFKEGRQQLVGDNRINPNSAADYINNFRCMIEGLQGQIMLIQWSISLTTFTQTTALQDFQTH